MFTVMKSKIRYSLLLVPLLVLLLIGESRAQISLAPTSLTIHDNTRIGEIYVTNNGSSPQEVSVRFQFAYPVANESGNVQMVADTLSKREQYGLDDVVRVFPRRLVLQPNQSQSIRFQVMPMPDRPDGVYWTRAVISSQAVTEDIGESDDMSGIRTSIGYILEQNIPVFFHQGSRTTGIEVSEVRTHFEDNQLRLVTHLRRNGNSPFMGTMTSHLYGPDGTLIETRDRPAYFYFDDLRNTIFDMNGMEQGRYRVEFHFETQRRDMRAQNLVQAPRYTHTIEVDL